MIEFENLYSHLNGFGDPWGFSELGFDSIAAPPMGEQQINFRAAMGGSEIGLGGLDRGEDLFYSESFPRSTPLGMSEKTVQSGQAEQTMKKPRVSEIYLRGFDLSLPNILMPGLQLADDECSRKNIKVGTNGFIRKPHRSS